MHSNSSIIYRVSRSYLDKALVSGTIPSFLDVAMNFGSDEMKIDSFIHQLKQRKQKIVFAGDDTWTSLFKGYFTRETANRDSLFVNDFHVGDINVTNALKSELNRDDWKLLILRKLLVRIQLERLEIRRKMDEF